MKVKQKDMEYFNHNSWIYFNDQFLKAQDSGIDLFNQSLHYGFAGIEGIRAYKTHNGTRIFKVEQHLQRLKKTCQTIGLSFPWDIDELVGVCYQLLQRNNLSSAYIRPLVLARHNMFLTPSPESDLAIALWEWGPFLGSGNLKMVISDYQRHSRNQLPLEIKASGQYLTSILATTEARKKGYDEAILKDSAGNISQASSNNLFFEKDDVLYTPPLGEIFPGITRETVLKIAKKHHFEVVEKSISEEELLMADSAFLTGTATGIVGIKSINDRTLPLPWNESLGASIQYAYKNLTHETENFEVII